jgi:hypothetical protein
MVCFPKAIFLRTRESPRADIAADINPADFSVYATNTFPVALLSQDAANSYPSYRSLGELGYRHAPAPRARFDMFGARG